MLLAPVNVCRCCAVDDLGGPQRSQYTSYRRLVREIHALDWQAGNFDSMAMAETSHAPSGVMCLHDKVGPKKPASPSDHEHGGIGSSFMKGFLRNMTVQFT